MPLEMETAPPPAGATASGSNNGLRKSLGGHARSRGDDDDNVVGLGVPHGDAEDDQADDAHEFAMEREEEFMDEIIMKHRSDMQQFVARTMQVNGAVGSGGGGGGGAGGAGTAHGDANANMFFGDHDNLQNIPPSPDRVDAAAGRFDPNFRTPQPRRGETSERLSQLSRTERTDRMRLAELSDVRNEKLGRAAVLRWNPHAKFADDRENRTFSGDVARRNGSPATRERALTSPPATTARMLGEYSKDYVQQAIDFTNHDLLADDEDDDHLGRDDDEDDLDDDGDDDDLEPSSPGDLRELIDHQLRGPLSAKKMRKYVKHVKHMETTIAQLVEQKEELMRNQAEFDKHASGMFPTLENLNNQLSQIVQDRMLQSQVNIKDDLDSELRILRVRLNELEAESKSRRNDAELQDQKSQLDIAHVKAEIASLGTTGSLQNHKMELLSSQIKQLQQEISQSIEMNKTLSRQFQIVDQRIATIQFSVKEKLSQSFVEKPPSQPFVLIAVLIVVVAVVLAVLSADRCSGMFGRCRPLT